jgi:hypothetical protein
MIRLFMAAHLRGRSPIGKAASTKNAAETTN